MKGQHSKVDVSHWIISVDSVIVCMYDFKIHVCLHARVLDCVRFLWGLSSFHWPVVTFSTRRQEVTGSKGEPRESGNWTKLARGHCPFLLRFSPFLYSCGHREDMTQMRLKGPTNWPWRTGPACWRRTGRTEQGREEQTAGSLMACFCTRALPRLDSVRLVSTARPSKPGYLLETTMFKSSLFFILYFCTVRWLLVASCLASWIISLLLQICLVLVPNGMLETEIGS